MNMAVTAGVLHDCSTAINNAWGFSPKLQIKLQSFMWLFPGVGRVKLRESAKLSEFVSAQYLAVNFCLGGGSRCLHLFKRNGLFYDGSPLADSDLTANRGRQQLVFMGCGPVMRSRPLILVARLLKAWLHYAPSARHQTRRRALRIQKGKKNYFGWRLLQAWFCVHSLMETAQNLAN